ncbi:MAG: hypothetical protein R6X19_03575, partial [Kiritimatiellia bacterium]
GKIRAWNADGTPYQYPNAVPIGNCPTNLILEGVGVSYAENDIKIFAEVKGSNSNTGVSTEAFTTVMKVDLDVDADHDGDIDSEDDRVEATEGGWCVVNQNDSNTNGVEDKLEAGHVGGEVDLRAIRLKLAPEAMETGVQSLDVYTLGSGRVSVWTHSDKGAPATNEWDMESGPAMPATLYVEGLEASTQFGDVVLRLGYNGLKDDIKLTVVGADLDVDSDYDGDIDNNDESAECSTGGLVAVGQLLPISLKLNPGEMDTGTVTLEALSGGDKVSFSLTNGTPVELPVSWAAASFPSSLNVEGIAPSASLRDVELRLRLSSAAGTCEDKIKLTVLKVDMTAYRPTTELPAYGHPFAKHAVPEGQEETSGAGIRRNGDTESATNENDLIEVELKAEPYPTPSGLTYVLKRSNSNIKVWDSQTMDTAILDSGTEATITFSSATNTVWVENPNGGSADLELIARSGSIDICSDKVHFYPFTSIVIALGGETQNPSDPADANHGIYQQAVDLYEQGYDVHMYDEDNVGYDGAGATYDEVVSAIQDRNVDQVAIYGYSHGGGSTYLLANLLNNNREEIISGFEIKFTAYIDAIEDTFPGDMDQENRRPPSSSFHVNFYQEGHVLEDGGLDGGPINNPPGADFETNVDNPTPTETHQTIDDDATILNGIETRLTPQVAR